MDEPDSTGSDVEQSTQIQETQHMAQRMESEESYSDSDPDEPKQLKSMYNVYKTGHVPGKYKQGIEPQADQTSARETHEGSVAAVDANQNIQALEKDVAHTDCDALRVNTDNKEERQMTAHVPTGEEMTSAETGIFEKSMLVISPVQQTDEVVERKVYETATPKVQPPIPPRPSREISISSKSVDCPKTEVASPNSRPKPAPRKSKRSSEAYSDNQLLVKVEVQQISPVPSPRLKRKPVEVDLPPLTENEKTIAPDVFQPTMEVSEVENMTFLEMSESSDTVGSPEKKARTDTEEKSFTRLIDTVDISTASNAGEEKNNEDCTYFLGQNDTLISDTMMKDVMENNGSHQPAILGTFEERSTGNINTDHEHSEEVHETECTSSANKDDSDTECEENATVGNDFRDSAKDDINDNQDSSGSESDGPFRTPDPLSNGDNYEFYDSNDGVLMHNVEHLDKDVKADESESNKAKDLDIDNKKSRIEDIRETGEIDEIKLDFEESVVVIGKGSFNEAGNFSISTCSKVSSSKLAEASFAVDKCFAEKEEEAKPASVRDGIAIFESIRQENNDNSSNTNKSNFEKSSRSYGSSLDFEVLSRDDSDESLVKTAGFTENVKLKRKVDIDEILEMSQGSNIPPPAGPKPDGAIESQQSVMTVSADGVQNAPATNTCNLRDINESLDNEQEDIIVDLPQRNDVISAARQDVIKSEDELPDDEKPPPIPPKSDLVLESMRSYTVDNPPNIPSRSLAVEADIDVADHDTCLQSDESVRNIAEQSSLPPIGQYPSQLTAIEDQTSEQYQVYDQKQTPINQQYQQQIPPYGIIQYPQQQPQIPVLGPFNYTNSQYVNPYHFYKPTMDTGMCFPNLNMANFPQPQPPYCSYPNYGTANVHTPNRYFGYSSQFVEDNQYEEVHQPVRDESSSSHVNRELKSSAHVDHLLSSNVEHRRPAKHVENRQSPSAEHRTRSSAYVEHRKLVDEGRRKSYDPQDGNSGSHKGRATDNAKLKKSDSEALIKVDKKEDARSSSMTPSRKRTTRSVEDKHRQRRTQDVLEETENAKKAENYYVYFKGINPDTKKESLGYFVENTVGGEVEPESILFNYSGKCALVPVSADHRPDTTKLKDRIKEKGIENARPDIYEVPPPVSIAVSSEEDIKNTETLGLYFENPRSGGADILKDPYESEDGSVYIVEYGNPDVVRRVCEKTHVSEKKPLRVSPYYECKGGVIWNSELHVVKIPEPVVIDLQSNYLIFIQRDCCKDLLSALEMEHCNSSFTEKGLKVQCSLTPRTTGFKRLVKNWESSVRRIVDNYIAENIVERDLPSCNDIWSELLQFFKAENIESITDLVSTVHNAEYSFSLVGFLGPVKREASKLEAKIEEIRKRLRRMSEPIQFHPMQLRLLKWAGVFERLKKEIDDIEVYSDGTKVTVEGQPDDVRAFKVKMYEIPIKFASRVHGLSKECVDFVRRKLKDKVSKVIKNYGIIAEWEIDMKEVKFCLFEDAQNQGADENDYTQIDEEVYSYANVDDVGTNTMQIFETNVVEKHVTFQAEIIEVFDTQEWMSFSENITEVYEEAEVKRFDRTILIYGMKQDAQKVYELVAKFVQENSIFEEEMECGTICIKFIKRHKAEMVSDLENKFDKLNLCLNDDSVQIRGTKRQIAETKKELKKVFESMICKDHPIEKVAVKDVFRDEKEHGTIDSVENQTRCIIQLPGENETVFLRSHTAYDKTHTRHFDSGHVKPTGATAMQADGGATARPAKQPYKAKSGMTITLVKGEIGQQDGDVIVVTTSQNLNLSSGKACSSVLKAGGKALQDECKTKYPKDINHGDIATVNGGGSLKCNKVYLTALPNWSSEDNAKQVLQSVMKKCLEMASKDRKYSILFCAMGTGQLKYPTGTVAMMMYQSVIDFDHDKPKTTLRDVRFVLYQKDDVTIKVFEEEERLRIEGGGTRPIFELQKCGLKIELLVENIAEQKVDAILCSTSPNMDLSRNGACQALLKAGGNTLQDECKSKYSNHLESGQLAEISGGKLPCKSVFLTVLPSYSQGAIDAMKNVLIACLNLAKAKGYTSVAFPALGTGFLKYPKEDVCRCMFETVFHWGAENTGTSVKTVRFIMHAKDREVTQKFKAYIQTEKGRAPRKGRKIDLHGLKEKRGQQHVSQYNVTKDGFLIRGIQLNVFTDDILNQKTDVIVSSVNSDFEFIGGVAKSLLKKCPKLTVETKDKKSKLKKKGLVLTSSVSLPSKCIMHLRYVESTAEWKQQMLKCLAKANEKRFKTIAFPVLGTGQGSISFSPEAIAECLFDAVNDFSATSRPYIYEVRLIVYKGQPFMYKPIHDALHKKIQQAAMSKHVGAPGIKEKAKGIAKGAWNMVMGKVPGEYTKSDWQKLVQQTSSMVLKIHSDSQENIDKCTKELDAKLEQAYTKRKVLDYKEIIKSLTPEEEKQLDIDALANIVIDKSAGIISIEGPLKTVADVDSVLKNILLKIERRRNDVKTAEEYYKLVRWYFEEITKLAIEHVEYDKFMNFKIEQAYKDNKNEFQFTAEGQCYVIDLLKLVEYPDNDPTNTVRVLRKDILKLAKSALPEEWAPMKETENLRRVNIPNTEQIYKDIEQRFLSEVRGGQYSGRIMFDKNKVQISKIERIQNKTLYQQYQARKTLMTQQKSSQPTSKPIERDLWHGTTHDAVDSIEMHGFNRSYCGKNGIWFGAGVYFARDASYSARGWLTGANPGTTGVKGYIFLVKVLTGEYCKGNDKMRYLPPVDPNTPTMLYDCAVDDVNNPMEFVIFHDTQAYPEFIITFTA